MGTHMHGPSNLGLALTHGTPCHMHACFTGYRVSCLSPDVGYVAATNNFWNAQAGSHWCVNNDW